MPDELLIGDRAPAFRTRGFAKGSAFVELDPGRIYVLEFWAPWCGPCRRMIPHLTALQRAHPEVVVVGVAVQDEPGAVADFVEEMGDSIGYSIALDTAPEEGSDKGWMYRNWCEAAYRSGIPTSCIVDADARVAWIGHPQSIEEPLDAILSGTWRLDERAVAYARNMEIGLVRERFALRAATARWKRTGDARSALSVYDGLFALQPSLGVTMGADYLEILLSISREGAKACVKNLVSMAPDDEDVLFKAGTALLECARSDTATGARLDQGMIALSIETLVRAEAALKDKSSARDRVWLDMSLAEALHLSRQQDAALARARSALDRASSAGMRPEVLADLEALHARCAIPPE